MSASSTPGLVLRGEPRVQLLPPSVKQREKARSTRRLMVLLVILAVVIAGAGTAAVYLLAQQEEAALASAQARTTEILAEQQKYAEGAQVAGQVAATKTAQQIVTANEIDWAELSSAVLAHLPCGCRPELSFSGPAPWEPTLIPEGPLRPERVATMTVVVPGSEFLAATRFAAAVRALEGLADAVVMSTDYEDGEYRTTVVLTFDADVLAQRFSVEQPVAEAPSTDPAPDATEGSEQ